MRFTIRETADTIGVRLSPDLAKKQSTESTARMQNPREIPRFAPSNRLIVIPPAEIGAAYCLTSTVYGLLAAKPRQELSHDPIDA